MTKANYSERVGRKIMGLNHFSDMTAKLPVFYVSDIG